jgi:hypothetical protein
VGSWLEDASIAARQARSLRQRILNPRETLNARQARLLGMTEDDVDGHMRDFKVIMEAERQKQIGEFRSAVQAQKPDEAKPEPEHSEEPVYGDWDETAIEQEFPRSELRKCLARAIATKRTKDWKELYQYLDDTNVLVNLMPANWEPAGLKKSDRLSYELAYKHNRHLMDEYARKVWTAMLPKPPKPNYTTPPFPPFVHRSRENFRHNLV